MSDLHDVIDAAMAAHLESLHTAIPGVIVSGSGGIVNVRPSLDRRLRDGRIEEMPIVPRVPVWFPRGGGSSITWPVGPGDGCLLVFSERSLEEWKTSNGLSVPSDPRRHGLTDAIAFVGLSATGQGSDVIEMRMGDTLFSVSGSAVRVTAGGSTMTLDSGGLSVTGSAEISGGLDVSGSLENNGVNVGSTHRHGGVLTGGGTSGGPQ